MKRAVAVVTALAACLLAGAALAWQPGRTDEAEVRRFVKDHLTALYTGDGDTACAQLTRAGRQGLAQAAADIGAGRTCQDLSRSLARAYREFRATAAANPRGAASVADIENPSVRIVAIDRDSATVRTTGFIEGPMKLTRGDGGWRIAHEYLTYTITSTD